MEFTNGEYIIFNHSVPHPDCPQQKSFTRAKSILSGFYMMPLPDNPNGTLLIYLTHTDPCGSIPHAIINFSMTKGAPGIMNKLEACAEKYVEYSRRTYPAGHVHGWTTPKISWESSENYPAASVAASAMALMPVASAAGDGGEGSPTSLAATSAVNAGGGQDTESALTLTMSSAGAAALQAASGALAGGVSSAAVSELQHQVQDLKRRLFLAQQRAGGTLSLAPVAPRKEDDPPAVQQFRALMSDATTTVDRMYIQEARVPTTREYLLRLHYVLEGLVTTIPVA
jgi:hypothetical protein